MRPFGWNRKGLARRQFHLFFGVLQKNADRSLYHIKSVADLVVIVPRHLLDGADLQLDDAKTRACGVTVPALDLVEPARILHTLHVVSSMATRIILRWSRVPIDHCPINPAWRPTT